LATDVLAEKKVSQFAAIVAAVPVSEEPPVEGDEDAGEDAVGDGDVVEVAFGLEPPQPATRAPSPRTISGTAAL
jgi:hypothetical protein